MTEVAEAFSSNEIRLRKPCRKSWKSPKIVGNGMVVLGLDRYAETEMVKTGRLG